MYECHNISVQVALFSKVSSADGTGPKQWVYTDYKRPHLHDVRSLAIVSGRHDVPVLVSGGVDGSLVAYSVNTFLKVVQ